MDITLDMRLHNTVKPMSSYRYKIGDYVDFRYWIDDYNSKLLFDRARKELGVAHIKCSPMPVKRVGKIISITRHGKQGFLTVKSENLIYTVHPEDILKARSVENG